MSEDLKKIAAPLAVGTALGGISIFAGAPVEAVLSGLPLIGGISFLPVALATGALYTGMEFLGINRYVGDLARGVA